jgi:hypothetical protein
MTTKSKLAMQSSAERLSPEVHEFLDSVIVSALLQKYLCEENTQNSVEACGSVIVRSNPIRYPQRAARRKM